MFYKLRRVLYRFGVRPKKGSVFYSHNLAWLFAMQDVVKRMRKLRK